MTGSASGSGQEEIQQAIVCLPKRQREALELREREGLSYEAIAARVGMSPGSVAQLISRARINLYDELRGTLLASVAAPSPECERALPLIAAREDGQFETVPGGDADWLEAHLTDCERCRPAVEQMAEASAAYRGSPGSPLVAAAPSAPSAQRAATSPPPAPERAKQRRRRMAIAATGAALLLLGGIAAALVGNDGAEAPPDPAAAVPGSTRADAPARGGTSRPAKTAKAARRRGKAEKAEPSGRVAATNPEQGDTGAAPTPVVAAGPPGAAGAGTPNEAASAPDRSSGKAAVDAPQQISAPKAGAKPKPAATSTPPPQSAPAPTPEPAPTETSPGEEQSDAPGRSGEAPGKPSNRPPR